MRATPGMADAVAARLRAAGCVFAEDEAAVLIEAAADAVALEALEARRIAGEPLEVIVGWVEFAGLRIPVAPGLFVPRRRTALVADAAIEHAPRDGVVVDLCCGVGAVAIAVATARPDVTVWVSDIDPAAVALAARTLEPLGARAVAGDMADGLPAHLAGTVGVVTACPPYVPTAQIERMPREAREAEPRSALDGGPDGTDLQARVFAAAAALLRRGGVAIVETSEPQLPRTLARARENGLTASALRNPSLGAVAVLARSWQTDPVSTNGGGGA